MKKLLVFSVAVLFLIGFSCPTAVHARGGHGGGGHGGGHGGARGGFHGGHSGVAHSGGFHSGGFHSGGSSHTGSRYYGGYGLHGASSSFGWYGVGLFGGSYSDPWYYYGTPYYDPYSDPYSVPLASGYPDDSAASEEPDAGSEDMQGEWVVVPGQLVDGRWIPPHEAWAPKSP